MGVDVEIAVEGATEWRHDHRLAKEALNLIGADHGRWVQVIDGALVISGMSRYYGPGYERGPWPQIYAAIRAVREMYPCHVVRYGGDIADWQYHAIADDEYLEKVWRHWLGPHGDDYHSRPTQPEGSPE
jgi:hypothetical protein